MTCLDWQFVTGSGKNRQTHRHAVVIVETGLPVIPLEIRREHLLDKVGEFLGHDDIDFESAEFSRTFHVTAADRKWAYDVIHTRTMEYLLQAPPFTIAFGFGRGGRGADRAPGAAPLPGSAQGGPHHDRNDTGLRHRGPERRQGVTWQVILIPAGGVSCCGSP